MAHCDEFPRETIIDLVAEPVDEPVEEVAAVKGSWSVARPLLALPLLAGVVVFELWALGSMDGGTTRVLPPSPVPAQTPSPSASPEPFPNSLGATAPPEIHSPLPPGPQETGPVVNSGAIRGQVAA